MNCPAAIPVLPTFESVIWVAPGAYPPVQSAALAAPGWVLAPPDQSFVPEKQMAALKLEQ
jgi:hypothetical protein